MGDKDPMQALWKSQHHQPVLPELTDIRQRAEGFQSVIRKRNLIEYAAAFLVIVLFSRTALISDSLIEQLGAVMIILAAVFVSYKLHRIAKARTIAEVDLALSLIEFHRLELQRQHRALVSVWKWYLAPFLPGLLVFTLSSHLSNDSIGASPVALLKSLLSVAVIGLVFCVIHWLNQREAKNIARKIEELTALDE
ncbi:MAG: hypothetical protein AB8B79_07370 [Granulosicoccus sp.]